MTIDKEPRPGLSVSAIIAIVFSAIVAVLVLLFCGALLVVFLIGHSLAHGGHGYRETEINTALSSINYKTVGTIIRDDGTASANFGNNGERDVFYKTGQHTSQTLMKRFQQQGYACQIDAQSAPGVIDFECSKDMPDLNSDARVVVTGALQTSANVNNDPDNVPGSYDLQLLGW